MREALGRAYYRAGRFSQAAVEFEAVVESHHVDDYAHFCLGRALSMIGQVEPRPPPPGAGLEPAPGPARLPLLPPPARRLSDAGRRLRGRRRGGRRFRPRSRDRRRGDVVEVEVGVDAVDLGAAVDQPAAAAAAGGPVAADRQGRRTGQGEVSGSSPRKSGGAASSSVWFRRDSRRLWKLWWRLRSVTIVAPPPTASATLTPSELGLVRKAPRSKSGLPWLVHCFGARILPRRATKAAERGDAAV